MVVFLHLRVSSYLTFKYFNQNLYLKYVQPRFFTDGADQVSYPYEP